MFDIRNDYSYNLGRRSMTQSNGAEMQTRLEDLLYDRDWLLADGATGTNLFQA